MSNASDFVIENVGLREYKNGVTYLYRGEEYKHYAELKKYTGTDKTVVVPDGVKYIGEKAFQNCADLIQVSLPDSVERIESSAFSGCSNLSQINLPEGLSIIESKAFSGCKVLAQIILPAGVKHIGYEAFSGCVSLTKVVLPEGLRYIENRAFSGCSSLTQITIPEGIECIGESAFENCCSLSEISLPHSLTKIEGSAFYNCTSLTHISLPDGVKTVARAFWDCTNLVSVKFPKSVIQIGDLRFRFPGAFDGCTNLKEIILLAEGMKDSIQVITPNKNGTETYSEKYEDAPLKIDSFESKGYHGRTIVTSPDFALIVPNMPLSSIDGELRPAAVLGFAKQTVQGNPYPEERAAEYKKYIRGQRKKLYKKICPQSPELLRYMLQEKIIPREDIETLLEKIGGESNPELAAVLLEYRQANFKPVNPEKDFTLSVKVHTPNPNSVAELKKLWKYERKSNGFVTILGYKGAETEITVPSKIGSAAVDEIGEYAFSPEAPSVRAALRKNLEKINSVVLPEGIKSIGDCAFSECVNLKQIVLQKGLKQIGYAAFQGCLNLEHVAIPNGVTNIGAYTFHMCTSLTSIVLPRSVKKIGNSVFWGCEHLEKITLDEANSTFKLKNDLLINTKEKTLVFCQKGKRGTVEIPEDITVIGGAAFQNCSGITQVILPDCISQIGEGAFNACTGLTEITLPQNLNKIGMSAFYGCNGITNIDVPAGVTSIDDGAFSNCKALERVTLPDHFDADDFHTGDGIFDGCDKLTLFVPEGSEAMSYAKRFNIPFETL